MKNSDKYNNPFFQIKINQVIVLSIVLIITIILILSYKFTQKEIQNLKKSQYHSFDNRIKQELDRLIQNKHEINTIIAISLSKGNNLINALKNKNKNILKLDEFSNEVKRMTPFKNVWFQVIDKKGDSFYRSWTSKSGDSLKNIRADVAKMIKNPKIISSVSTGKFDMTLKTLVPIVGDNKEFLGIFEIITHFDSIAKKISLKDGVDIIFLVDKSYKKQITKAFSKIFIDDYYIALLNPNQNIINLLETNGIEFYLNSKKSFLIDNKNQKFITTYSIPNIEGKTMGYGLVFKDLNTFEMEEINYFKQNKISLSIVIILLIVIIGYYFINLNHKKTLLKQQESHEKEIVKNTKFFTIGQIAAGITHEINTPLTFIKGTVEMTRYDLEDMPDNSFKKSLLDDNSKIMWGLKRIAMIVESMREMSQKTSEARDSFNMYSSLITVIRVMYNRIKHTTKVYINNELFIIDESDKEKYNYLAYCNRQRIEQVWTIIINNALDELIKIENYEERRIDINISSTGDTTTVSFHDNAGGIDADIIDNIFEPFVSNKESSGIGIGLNVAKKILDEHDATIMVENKNSGAYFEVTLLKKSDVIH